MKKVIVDICMGCDDINCPQCGRCHTFHCDQEQMCSDDTTSYQKTVEIEKKKNEMRAYRIKTYVVEDGEVYE